ncbi:MAG: c-type cytochrome [Acidobacteria bacterium]|nr:c-type cytochrome [Acidobacteriota bacterium]
MRRTGRGEAAVVSCGTLLVLLVSAIGCDQLMRKRSLGETVWRDNCARCHGIDGGGTVLKYAHYPGTNLLDDHWENGGEDFEMESTILEGIFPTMPSFDETLSGEEIKAVIEHIRSLRGGR